MTRHNGGMDDTQTWMRERIDGRLAGGAAISWLVLLQIALALEPATKQAEPAYGVALELTMWLLLATMVTGLVMQRRWGLFASLVAAGFFTALSVACPVSGHHAFGAWWFGQMACALGLGVISVVALHWSGHLPEWFPTARHHAGDATTPVESDPTT